MKHFKESLVVGRPMPGGVRDLRERGVRVPQQRERPMGGPVSELIDEPGSAENPLIGRKPATRLIGRKQASITLRGSIDEI